MAKSLRAIAALVVLGALITPSAYAEEMFNDESIYAPEPNAFGRAHADDKGYWSNVLHGVDSDDVQFGPGSWALLHGGAAGEGDIMGDAQGVSKSDSATPYLDFIYTNDYGAIAASDPNDALSAVIESRFAYPGEIVIIAMYGYYSECFAGARAISGVPIKGEAVPGAASIDSPLWCGNTAHVMGATEDTNDEFVPIYEGHGGIAKSVRDRNNLDGEQMVYLEVLEDVALTSVDVCAQAPDVCANRDAARKAADDQLQAGLDLFDQDCGDGGGPDYSVDCENQPIVALWDQGVSCSSEDVADRAEEARDHSNGNGCIGPSESVPNEIIEVLPEGARTIPGAGGVVIPDPWAPNDIAIQAGQAADGCYVRQVTGGAGTPPAQTAGCSTANEQYEKTLEIASDVVPDYVDTPARPSNRVPPAPEGRAPDRWLGFSDSRKDGDDTYRAGSIPAYRGSLITGLHIVTWVGPAQEIDAEGNLIGTTLNEDYQGWRTASIRDVDYFNFAGEDAGFVESAVTDPVGFLLNAACFPEAYLQTPPDERDVCNTLATLG